MVVAEPGISSNCFPIRHLKHCILSYEWGNTNYRLLIACSFFSCVFFPFFIINLCTRERERKEPNE